MLVLFANVAARCQSFGRPVCNISYNPIACINTITSRQACSIKSISDAGIIGCIGSVGN